MLKNAVIRCDKKVDCHDKSDEQNCNYRQQHDEVNSRRDDWTAANLTNVLKNQDHECKVEGRKDGLFIPKEKKCDGYFDCRDKSDEEGCKGMSCEVCICICICNVSPIDTNMILWKYLHPPCSCPSSDARTGRNASSSIRSATTGQTVTNPIRSYFNSHSKFCWQNYSTINHQFHPKLFLFSFQILAQLSKRSWNTAGPSVLTDLMRKTAVSAFLYLYHPEYIAKSLEKLKPCRPFHIKCAFFSSLTSTLILKFEQLLNSLFLFKLSSWLNECNLSNI